LHNRAKFREDRSIRYHIAIFVGFSRWRPPPSRFLKDSKFQRSIPCRGPICVTVPNFIKIRQTVAEVWRFNGFFSKWRPSAFLELSGAYWDQPRRLLGGLYRFAKFGWNRCSTFDNMKVLIFCAFGLKTPIHAPKIGVLGRFDSLSREHY